MPYLILAENQFANKKTLSWLTYQASNALLTQKHIEFVNLKEFTKLALREEKDFIVYILAFSIQNIEVKTLKKNKLSQVHYSHQALISSIIMGKKVEILVKYLNYSDVFSTNSIAKLLEHNGINNHLIDIDPSK